MQGKIIKGIAGFYYIYAENDEIYECKAKGIFRKDKQKPLVGDNVEIEVLDEQEKEGSVTAILPRKNSLIRPAVANVDQAFVIFAMENPKPNFMLLDRFLIMMEKENVPAVICFNKKDLAKQEELELLSDAAEAIKQINKSDYLAVVVTNQPVIARGEVTWNELDEIHNKMETLLGKAGAYIDGLYFCPHHPHKGYEGEIPELKIDCDCRKPKPGMLLKAAAELNIDLNQSFMIGDSDSDIQAGEAAGCKAIKIEEGGLLEAVRGILNDNN